MFKGIKNLWITGSTKGWHLPFLHDPITKRPSITLLFPYITFVLSVISLIVLHFKPSVIVATSTSLVFWAMSVVFYLLRKLHKSKINISTGTLELEGEENDE